MMMLRFAVTNHRSLRDRAELDFRRSSLRTIRPRAGERWADHVYPVAGVFGANASGKSTVIDALAYAVSAVEHSATAWQDDLSMRRAPFLLDQHQDEPSSYEFDLVLDGVRHEYGFEVDARGIRREWLRDLPGARWRTLISRDRRAGPTRLHASIPPVGGVTDRELLLSRARLLKHPQLRPIAQAIISQIEVVPVQEADRARRLHSITDALAQGDLSFEEIEGLLRIADIGVQEVRLREESLPPKYLTILSEVRAIISRHQDEPGSPDETEVPPDVSEAVIRSLEFIHRGEPFPIAWESQGTIAWLALIVPAVEALRTGGLLCIDEIDASLHSHLVETLIGFFADPEVNRLSAQLLFTSHDTFLLSPLSDVHLDPEQVWFTEKHIDGATELISLSDFPRHPDANVAKRYLSGRYGAVPRTAPSALLGVLEARPEYSQARSS